MTNEMKTIRFFSVVLLVLPHKVVLSFESVDACNHQVQPFK